MDNFFQRINPYVADKIGAFSILIGQRANFIHWIGIYLLDKAIYSLYNRDMVNNLDLDLKHVTLRAEISARTVETHETSSKNAASTPRCLILNLLLKI